MNEQLFSLPFDQFQRYFALRKCLGLIKDCEGTNRLNLIDVGGHPGVLTDFLVEDDVVILDSQPCERPNYVQADACALPFEDGTFDVATTVDVFEHIPSGQRARFLDELFRVSKEYVVLAAPFDDDAVVSAEKILFEFVRKILGESFAEVHPLKEHIENGLPSKDFLQHKIEQKESACFSFPNGQLYNWLTLNLIKHYIFSIPDGHDLEKMLDGFYNRHLVSHDIGEPGYRTFFVVSKSRKEAVLDKVSREFDPSLQGNKSGNPGLAAELPLFELFVTLFSAKADILANQTDNDDCHDRVKKIVSELEQRISRE